MRSYLSVGMLFCVLTFQAQQTDSFYVHFDNDDSSLDTEDRTQLRYLIATLERHSDFQIDIIGHTDQDGSHSYNEVLAEKRATSVKEYLLSLGVSENYLASQSKGERELLHQESSSLAKSRNRRVELKYTLKNFKNLDEMLGAITDEQPTQAHLIDPDVSQLIDLKGGTSVYVPKSAFVNIDGSPVSGKVELTVIEAFSLIEFMQQGLSTESKGALLETGGMMHIAATVAGKAVRLGDNKNLELIYPVQKVEEDMELFYGETSPEGEMTWIPTGQSMEITQAKNQPLMIDLDSIINYDMGRLEKPKALFAEMPQRPRMESKPYPPSSAVYSSKKYKKLYENYEMKLAKWKAHKPVYLLDEEAWQREVDKRLAEISTFHDRLMEVEYSRKAITAVKAIGRLEGRRAPSEMIKKLFAFLNGPMQVQFDDKALYKAAFGNYTREILSERKDVYPSKTCLIPPNNNYCEGLKNLVFNAEKIAREKLQEQKMETYRKTGKIDREGFGSYVAKIRKMGWINCDRFRREGFDLTSLTVNNAEKGTRHYLVFKNMRSMLSGSLTIGDLKFNGIPVGEPVKLIGIKLVDDKPHMAVKDFTLEENGVVTLNYKPSKLNDIKAELSSVDAARNSRLTSVDTATSLNIFPNPAADNFTAQALPFDQLSELSIFDMGGKLVKEIETDANGQSVSLTDFSNGLYVVRATYLDGRVASEQLVVQR